MDGTSGNSVQVFPEQRAVVVVAIITVNYDMRQTRLLIARLLIEQVLPSSDHGSRFNKDQHT